MHPPARWFPSSAVWFGGLVLLGTCALPHADEGLLAALPRFSSVAFAAMVATVVTGVPQGWRSGRPRVAWLVGLRVRYPEGRSHLP